MDKNTLNKLVAMYLIAIGNEGAPKEVTVKPYRPFPYAAGGLESPDQPFPRLPWRGLAPAYALVPPCIPPFADCVRCIRGCMEIRGGLGMVRPLACDNSHTALV
jgi:hypothetical protein